MVLVEMWLHVGLVGVGAGLRVFDGGEGSETGMRGEL